MCHYFSQSLGHCGPDAPPGVVAADKPILPWFSILIRHVNYY